MEMNTRSLQQSGSSKSKGKIMAKIVEEDEEGEEEEEEDSLSSGCHCFLCAIKEPDARLRRASLAAFFRELPYCEDDDASGAAGDGGQSCGEVVSAVWKTAMAAPDDPELPSLGAIRCMSLLLARALADVEWRRRGQNVYVPYYAAHVIGSYTIRSSAHAELAVAAGAVRPLLAFLGGSMTWVEQRAAARALGHLASYDATFPAVARYAAEAVPLAVRAASICVGDVYASFVALAPSKRPKYQRDLLTRGLDGAGVVVADGEDRKAEEWASQLQCWSLYFLSCLASRDVSSHATICQHPVFLRELCQMWGGLANGDSPAGVGLIRLLCRSAAGRGAIAACRDALSGLCDLARSSDDWQYMAIDCLLLLLDDRDTWHAVADATAARLVDLAELRHLGPRRRLGNAITAALLLDDDDLVHGRELGMEAKQAIASLREVQVERKRREDAMSRDELLKTRIMAKEKKRQGNDMFWHGEVEKAIELYTEALELCPLSRRRERLVLHSNRAQCRLARRDADAAVSDATRALSLARPAANAHARSLWRRAQAYDMKGMARESLLDCLAFAGAWLNRKDGTTAAAAAARAGNPKLPYCVARMISKQMSLTGLFSAVATNSSTKVDRDDRMPHYSDGDEEEEDDDDDDVDHDESEEEEFAEKEMKLFRSGKGLPIITDEAWRRLARRKKSRQMLSHDHPSLIH
uniref:ARM repeat N-terminal plant domain-containing protein n=1 Tax=Oryza punctata TaxID=4537 RepID=A0A0E0KAB4_ORYPU